jgi:hypothetical protein
MNKLLTIALAALFAVSTGVIAGGHMKGEKDAPAADAKKDDKKKGEMKKDDKAKK